MKLQTRPSTNSLPVTEVRPLDIILVDVQVGNLPPAKVQVYLEDLRNGLVKLFPEQELLILPKTDGSGNKGATLSVIRRS